MQPWEVINQYNFPLHDDLIEIQTSMPDLTISELPKVVASKFYRAQDGMLILGIYVAVKEIAINSWLDQSTLRVPFTFEQKTDCI